jgi:hypothetical protein
MTQLKLKLALAHELQWIQTRSIVTVGGRNVAPLVGVASSLTLPSLKLFRCKLGSHVDVRYDLVTKY